MDTWSSRSAAHKLVAYYNLASKNVSSGQTATPNQTRIELFFADLGPGLITGCADDDPSGISTYSMAGASFGYGLLWTALFSYPLMVTVQMMCGRLGMVTGRGLAGVVRRRYSKWVLWGACSLLIVANVINIAADLGGMADATQMLTGVNSLVWTPLYTAVIVGFLFWSSYRQIARIFKWITLVLLAYVITAFFAGVDWRQALVATLRPQLAWSRDYVAMIVGILGTTISPYLFFWQASQEVEEERAQGKNLAQRKGATEEDLRRLRVDVLTGMFASNFIMYFIILTTAATLHAHGVLKIETAKQAAEALRPLAGNLAYLLFTLGLIGTGMLGVPVLAGSCAYAISEAAAWRGSLARKPRGARKFYGVLAAAMTIGLAIDYAGFDAVKMLFWSAVITGALAPPLILLIVLLTNDRKVMGNRVNSPLERALGWATLAVMTAAAAALVIA
jgi:NRAMP (natural resistance-associated macrophage protein)-like metal ion transporter